MVLMKQYFEIWLLYSLTYPLLGLEEETGSTESGMAGYGVWYSEKDLLDLFSQREYVKLPAVRALTSTYHECLNSAVYNCSYDPPLSYRYPFIAVEGSHRNSRIIIGKELAGYLQATYLGNPPQSIVTLRKMFDKDKGMLRKAYFSLGMYVGAHHVRDTWIKEPVITTGYWLDQAGFSIAQRFNLETLPPADSPIYHWPSDLLRPDVAFFLNIPKSKLSNRPTNPFKTKLAAVYRRFKGVRVIEINETGTYRRIFAMIQTHLENLFMIKTQNAREDGDGRMDERGYVYDSYDR